MSFLSDSILGLEHATQKLSDGLETPEKFDLKAVLLYRMTKYTLKPQMTKYCCQFLDSGKH